MKMIMNNLDKSYKDLLQDILNNGVEKGDRTGTGTISIFGRQIRHKMKEGFPLLTTKKVPFKLVLVELLWFLRGDTNIRFLIKNDCHIWDGDAYKNYQSKMTEWFGNESQLSKEDFINKIKTDDEFANKWGELGAIYGCQWREWYTTKLIKTTLKDPLTGNDTYVTGDEWIDQIENLIKDLKKNPDSRRLMVSAWNVGELDQMVLPPCHYGFQMYTRELNFYELRNQLREKIQWSTDTAVTTDDLQKICVENGLPTRAISLMWNQRSVDTFLGLPFNIASYGLLLEIIAKQVNMIPDELIGNLGDVHLYNNHIEQAKEQIGRNYTPSERAEMLKQAMGEEAYSNAVKDLVPFGGGLSEYYEIHKIPHHSREPYELPKLNILDVQVDDIAHYELMDIEIHNYKSHPTIKAPLSN